MTLEQLEKAKELQGYINTAKANIDEYKKFEQAKEIYLEINDFDSPNNALYFSGCKKNAIVQTLIKIEQEKLNQWLSEFESL